MPATLLLLLDAVLDGALRLKCSGSGFDAGKTSLKMLVVYNDVTSTDQGMPFKSQAVDIDAVSGGAFADKLFTITGLVNGQKYVIKSLIGTVESAALVENPAAKPSTPIISVIKKQEGSVTVSVGLNNNFGGNYDNVFLFLKKISDQSIRQIDIGSFDFTGKATADMKIEKTLTAGDGADMEKETQYELAAVAYSSVTGYSDSSETTHIKVSDLLDAVSIGTMTQIASNKIRVPFTPGVDFLSSYVNKDKSDLAHPARITAMSLKAASTKFLVGLTVNTVALDSVYADVKFALGALVGQTQDASGALVGGTWQDAALVAPFVDFTIPDNLLATDVLYCVPSVISECARDSTNLYDFNSVIGGFSSFVGKIGAVNSLPTVQIDLVAGSDEDIIANFKVFFATQGAKDSYMKTNRVSGAGDLTTFMKIFNADSATDETLNSDNQLTFPAPSAGTISGVGVNNAATFSKTYSPAQYKDAVTLLGKKIGVSFSSKDAAGINQRTVDVASPVVKFIELVGTLASFAVDTTGTSDAPTITGTWTINEPYGANPFGSELAGFKLGYIKDNAPTSVDKGAWSSSTAYVVGDSVTSNGVTYVCIADAAAFLTPILSPYSYSSGVAYLSGSKLQYAGNNYTRKQDVVGQANTAMGVLPTDATKWTLETLFYTPIINLTDTTYWAPKFTTSFYPTTYVAGQRSVALNSDPAGVQFPPSTIINLVLQALYLDRNSSDPAARLQGAQLVENAPFGSHTVNSQVATVASGAVSYDNAANTATISLKDKISEMATLVTYPAGYQEHITSAEIASGRLVTKISDNAAMTLNLQALAVSSGAANKAQLTIQTTPGVEYKKYFQQELTIGANKYSSAIQEINLKLVKNLDLTAPTVVYSAVQMVESIAVWNPATVYLAGAQVQTSGFAYSRKQDGAVGVANTLAGLAPNNATYWTSMGAYTSSLIAGPRVTLVDKDSADWALTSSVYQAGSVRTEFGVTIAQNGSVLTNWSHIAIPSVATPDAMAASYKSSTNFNAGDASLAGFPSSLFKIRYAGVWSAGIMMVSSDQGGRMIAIPSNAAFSSSIV
jgi:hypothetical protein